MDDNDRCCFGMQLERQTHRVNRIERFCKAGDIFLPPSISFLKLFTPQKTIAERGKSYDRYFRAKSSAGLSVTITTGIYLPLYLILKSSFSCSKCSSFGWRLQSRYSME